MANPFPRQPHIIDAVLPETPAQRYAREQFAYGEYLRQRRRQEQAEADARRQAIADRRQRQFGLSDFDFHQLRNDPRYLDLSNQLDQTRDTIAQRNILFRYRQRMDANSAADRKKVLDQVPSPVGGNSGARGPAPTGSPVAAAFSSPNALYAADGRPIPDAAVAHLRANPHLSPDFDRKYRIPGLSATLLA